MESWHLGRGRKIQPGQKIHASVAFCPKGYRPKAVLPPNERTKDWKDLIKFNGEKVFKCPNNWENIVEMDIFDASTVEMLIRYLENPSIDPVVSIYRLSMIALSGEFGG